MVGHPSNWLSIMGSNLSHEAHALNVWLVKTFFAGVLRRDSCRISWGTWFPRFPPLPLPKFSALSLWNPSRYVGWLTPYLIDKGCPSHVTWMFFSPPAEECFGGDAWLQRIAQVWKLWINHRPYEDFVYSPITFNCLRTKRNSGNLIWLRKPSQKQHKCGTTSSPADLPGSEAREKQRWNVTVEI